MAPDGPYANHLHLTPDNHASTSSLILYRMDALPDSLPTVSKYSRQLRTEEHIYYRIFMLSMN